MPINTSNLNYAGTGALLISEILTKVKNASDDKEKINLLKKHDSVPLRQILKGNFDPKIEWELPEGIPPFKRNEAPAGTEHTLLLSETRRLWHFVKGADPKLSKTKKELMFIQILEGLHSSEADILIAVKEKSLEKSYTGLTGELVRTAFGWNKDYKTA
jgi:hypothetical protein